MNSNCKYYENIDKNFEKAIELYQNEMSHDDAIMLLNSNLIVEKQIAILNLNTIKSTKEAELLVTNLTGQDGKIREATSFKLKEFMSNPDLIKYFNNVKNYETFFNATLDINGNICRNTISAIINLKSDITFCKFFTNKLINTFHALLNKLDEFSECDGKYKLNKEIFKLYWCLEDMYEFIDFIDIIDVKSILRKTKSVKEYTIREKTAKILTKNFTDDELIIIKGELKKDENYYVRRF